MLAPHVLQWINSLSRTFVTTYNPTKEYYDCNNVIALTVIILCMSVTFGSSLNSKLGLTALQLGHLFNDAIHERQATFLQQFKSTASYAGDNPIIHINSSSTDFTST